MANGTGGTGSYATRWNNKYIAKYFQQAKDIDGKITITDTSKFEPTWFPETFIKKIPPKLNIPSLIKSFINTILY